MRDIRVLLPSGQFSHSTHLDDARQLVRSGLAERMGAGAIQMYDGPSRIPAGTRYVHYRDTDDNPQGVCAFRRITRLPASMFRAVQLDVMA